MAPTLVTALSVLLMAGIFSPPAFAGQANTNSTSRKFKFLYFTSIMHGSHYTNLGASGKVLVRLGHQVVFLRGSSAPRDHTDNADFSYVVFNSSYSIREIDHLLKTRSRIIIKEPLINMGFSLAKWLRGSSTGQMSVGNLVLKECDDLLGDTATMKRLAEEKFDMLVADAFSYCNPLLAQALDIPFVLHNSLFVYPTRDGHWSGLPTDPSYMPERLLGLTDKMTFFQRVQNFLGYIYHSYLHHQPFANFDELKIKYNIKPEINTYESTKLAQLYFFHGSFGLEFPRPMQPNTLYVLPTVGLSSNQTMEDDVANFLDAATSGVVLFSLGTYVTDLEREVAQMFADSFSLLPYRVLWQVSVDLSGVKLGNNTKAVKWLPLPKVMEHVNVKIYVSHGGAPSMYEALWVGLPMVGIPLASDQTDNVIRLQDRGVGVFVDISTVTAESLSEVICRVATEPKFRKNAQRLSKIIRDLQTSSPPVDTIAHWILHVTKFGGDHLRPAVQDLNYLQRNLLDVYFFLAAVLALHIGIIVSFCYLYCKCVCSKTRKSHHKEE